MTACKTLLGVIGIVAGTLLYLTYKSELPPTVELSRGQCVTIPTKVFYAKVCSEKAIVRVMELKEERSRGGNVYVGEVTTDAYLNGCPYELEFNGNFATSTDCPGEF